uniref:glutaminase n=1 Tax=Ditylenchus dipsaci TaxID=166011 RepID=A0A915EJC2_9BILA
MSLTPHSSETLNTIGEILNRKRSVGQIMSKTAEGLSQTFDYRKASPEDLVFDLFKLPMRDEASIGKLVSVLRSFGLKEDDPRLRQTMEKIRELTYRTRMTMTCVHPCISLISQALRNQLIVPNWCEFTTNIKEIFEECRLERNGCVATYIPQLARQDPNR